MRLWICKRTWNLKTKRQAEIFALRLPLSPEGQEKSLD
jgi:hypothetical protein